MIKSILAALALITGGLLLYGYAFPYGVNVNRLWDKQTRLGVAEERIAGVGDEFLRRSYRLRENFNEFKLCRPNCSADIFQRRDDIIRIEWYEIFPRLEVFKDWGRMVQTQNSRVQFETIVKKYGREGAIHRCYPRIEYYGLRAEEVAIARFNGFECKQTPGTRAGG